MRNFFRPAEAPGWLLSVLNSIREALSDIWATPLRLKDYATTDLPAAADWKQGLAYDTTVPAVKYSDGTNWQRLMVHNGGAALTRVDDTNVTLTLGGTPATALLAATSLTLGWSGILASSRGGTGNGFAKFSGPATSEKTFTLPNASETIACLGQAQTFTATQTISVSGTGGLIVQQSAGGSGNDPSIRIRHSNSSGYGWRLRLDDSLADFHLDRETAGVFSNDIIKLTNATGGMVLAPTGNLRLENTAGDPGGSGIGIEIVGNASGVSVIQAYNRSTAAYTTLTLDGSQVDIRTSGGSTVATVSSTGLAVTGVITASTTIKTGTYTVANLPAAGTASRRAFVTDANATAFASVVAGGGANGVPVYDDGTNWRIG